MEKEIKFILNDSLVSTKVNQAKTLLDFIRIEEGLKGTKEGCREGDCGACTVLVGEYLNDDVKYTAINSCLFPVGKAEGKHIVTIEGLSGLELSPIQKEFNHQGASQCGFCTPGFVNSITNYVLENDNLNRTNAENSIAGNICRCTGYASIKRTVANVVEFIGELNFKNKSRIDALVENGILPKYFLKIQERIKAISTNNKLKLKSSNSQLVAGGTDLYVQRANSLLTTDINFASNLELNKINIANNQCSIGATVTIEELKNSDLVTNYFPMLRRELELFASLPIRNSATIGGNIVNASPIGDSTIIFLSLNSKVKISDGAKRRIIPLKDFYKGYKIVDLKSDEIIEELIFELPKDDDFFNFEKVSKRTHLDIASVNTAINISALNGIINTASLSAGGVSPIPLYLEKTSQFLSGRKISSELILETGRILQSEISPISDIRGSAEYKRLLLNQLLKSHFIKLFPQQIDLEVLL